MCPHAPPLDPPLCIYLLNDNYMYVRICAFSLPTDLISVMKNLIYKNIYIYI